MAVSEKPNVPRHSDGQSSSGMPQPHLRAAQSWFPALESARYQPSMHTRGLGMGCRIVRSA